jgi:hypothetical protein
VTAVWNKRVPGVACVQDAKLMDAFTERLRVLLVRVLGPATSDHLAEWRSLRVGNTPAGRIQCRHTA